MDKVDLIIERSNTPEEFISKIKKIVDRNHGDGSANSILEISNSEDEYVSRIKKLARAEPSRKDIEGQPLIDLPYLRDISTPDNLYKMAGSTMSMLGKLPAMLATPLTEAARSPLKYIAENFGENTSETPPIDTAAEYRQLGLSDRAGLSLFLQDANNALGIKNQPLVDIKSSRFPKAAQFLQGMTVPANAATMAMEGTLAKKLPTPEIITVGKVSLDTAMAYLKSVSKNSGLFEKLSKSGEIWNIATMIRENPAYMKYSPEKVFDELNGVVNRSTGRRTYGDGDIGNTNIRRGEIIEDSDFDQTQYVDPRMLRDMAIGELSDPSILNTDAIPAERIIRNEIRTTDPSDAIIKTIDDVNNAKFRLGDLENEMNAERMTLDNQLSLQKNAVMRDAIPEQMTIDNPDYRAELQWPAGLEVINDPSGTNIFPKTRSENVTTVTGPNRDYTPIRPVQQVGTGAYTSFEPSGKVISEPGNVSYFDSVDEINNPANPLNSIKNQKMLDIAQGKQSAPQTIKNPQYSENMGIAVERLSQLNKDLKNIGERKVSGVSNTKYLQMIDEKRKLEGFVYNNDNPNYPDQRSYSDSVDARNQMSLQETIQLRKKGNLMYNPDPTKMRAEQAPMSLAGQSIVRSVDEVLGNALDPAAKDVYSRLGTDMKNKIAYSDLISGNMRPNTGQNIDAGDLTYKAGIARSVLGDPWDRGVRPMGERLLNRTANIPRNILMQPGGRMATAGLTSLNEIMPDKNTVAEYRIPRSSDAIMDNMPMVVRKIGTMFGPEAVKALNEVKTSQELTALIGQLSQMSPQSFESDEYGRFDGIIQNPLLKQKAMEKIMNDEGSALEGANKMQLLINRNQYHGD